MRDNYNYKTTHQKDSGFQEFYTETDIKHLEDMALHHPSETFRKIAFSLLEREQARRSSNE